MGNSPFGKSFDHWVAITDAHSVELQKVVADPRRSKSLLSELAARLETARRQFTSGALAL